MYSDASGTGFAGYTVEHGFHLAHGQWNEVERSKNSTWRELAAVARTLESVSGVLYNSRVKWFTDNQNVVHIIRVGSKVFELQELASSHNAQLGCFNNRFCDIGTEAVDAFTSNWLDDNNWLCPPVHLVCRVLHHARACGCSGTLIVPLWKSVPFWPILCPDGLIFAPFVQGVMELPNADNLIISGWLGTMLPLEHSKLLVLRVVFHSLFSVTRAPLFCWFSHMGLCPGSESMAATHEVHI